MLPDSFSPVPDDFAGPCLIEVLWWKREGRARFWRANGCGYTDDPSQAGVYPASAARARCSGSDRIVPVDALAALNLEHARLLSLAQNTRDMIEAIQSCSERAEQESIEETT